MIIEQKDPLEGYAPEHGAIFVGAGDRRFYPVDIGVSRGGTRSLIGLTEREACDLTAALLEAGYGAK